MNKIKKKYLFLIIIVIIGVITGFIFANIISNNDQKIVYEKITYFFNNIKEDVHIKYWNNLLFSLKNNIIYLILITIFGLSIIGLFFNNFILFLKSFILGFIASSIINIYLYNGIVLSIIYVFPFMILNLFTYLIMISYANDFSVKLFYLLFKKKEYHFHIIIKKYFAVSLICLVLLLVSSLYETFITPFVLKLFSFLIK